MDDNKTEINTNSEDYKVGYRQGYFDGFNAACDKVIERLKDHKKDTDDGK